VGGGRLSGRRRVFRAHVAARLGPFVILPGQDGADEPDDGVAARENPDDVGAPPDLLVQPLLGAGRSLVQAGWSARRLPRRRRGVVRPPDGPRFARCPASPRCRAASAHRRRARCPLPRQARPPAADLPDPPARRPPMASSAAFAALTRDERAKLRVQPRDPVQIIGHHLCSSDFT
jgi:hypothetical protein